MEKRRSWTTKIDRDNKDKTKDEMTDEAKEKMKDETKDEEEVNMEKGIQNYHQLHTISGPAFNMLMGYVWRVIMIQTLFCLRILL